MKKIIKILSLFLCALLAINLPGVFSVAKANSQSNRKKKIQVVEKDVLASKKTIKLSWNKVPGAIGYKVFISTKNNFKKVEPQIVQQSKITFSQLKRGQTYYFKLCSIKLFGKNKLGPATRFSLKVPKKIKAPNFAKVVKESLDFGFDCFDGHLNTDPDRYLVYNDYDYYLINSPGVLTKNDMMKFANKYYSKKAVKSMMKEQDYIEKEEGLYVCHGGIGAVDLDSCSISAYKVNNRKYKLFLIYKDVFAEFSAKIQLVYENNRWVVDTPERMPFADYTKMDVSMINKQEYDQLVKQHDNNY